MNKWFVGVILLILILVISVFAFLPSKISATQSESAEVTQAGAFRVLSDSTKWRRWWKDENAQSPDSIAAPLLSYNGYNFRMISHEVNVIGVEITKGDFKLHSFIHLLTVKYDSLIMIWQTDTLFPGNNPFKRVADYQAAKSIKSGMKQILANFKPFAAAPVNIYNCTIYRTSTEDTTMLSAKFITKTPPGIDQYYAYFKIVQKSIEKQKGFVKSFPIMDIRQLGKDSFETQVAIPTNVKLKDDGEVFYRRMEPGNFIATNVMGGPYTTSEALKELYNFIADYNGQIMAKPFQILVTDRQKEPDTAKWMTKIYIPVVE